jgi:hypothetical protein
MQRSPRFGRLLGLAVVAAWLGSPASLVRAQSGKPEPAARPGEKAPEEDKGPPRISVLRLQVIKPEPAAENLPPGIARRARFGFAAAAREGTSLTFALDEPQRLILGVETKDCKITRFRDDRGTDLTPDPAEPAGGGMAAVPRFGQDEGAISAEVDPAGHRLTVTVHSPRLPTGGANRLLLDTVLAVRFARGVKTFEQKNVNLKLDKFTAGPYSLVVMGQLDANGNLGQGGRTQVVLFHQGPLRDVNKVAFVGPDGEQIQATINGSGQSGSVHQTHYSLAKAVETCTIRLSAPEAVETVSMAVEINTGIGFPAGARRRILPAPEPRPTAADAAPR